MTSRKFARFVLPLLLGGLAVLHAAPKPKDASTGDAPPELVSSTGSDGTWQIGAMSNEDLAKAAAQGDAKACLMLGDRLLAGNGIKPDQVRARELLRKAAAGGEPNAWFRLGKIYHDGLGVEPDRARAYEYYLDAARRGVPEAQYNVGAMLASGRGVRRDFAESLAWLIIAQKSGAEGDGEARLRERLVRYPKTIAEGEARARALEGELAGKPATPGLPEATAPVITPTLVAPQAPTIAPPQFDTLPARIELPVAPLPVPQPEKK